MFTLYAHTDKMQAEGKLYNQSVTTGSWGYVKSWYDILCNHEGTDRCKIVRDKDRETMLEYRRETASES